MRSKFWIFGFMFLFLLAVRGLQAQVDELGVDLYLDFPLIPIFPTAEEKREPLSFEQFFQWGPKRQRIFVPVFTRGHTLYPTISPGLKQTPRFSGKDPLAQLLAAAYEAGVQVYATVDCLHWTPPNTPPKEDVFARHPEWQELDWKQDYHQVPEGKFASPFNPEVRRMLVSLVQEVAREYPQLDGVLLECYLSLSEVLGYSERARGAYIRTEQIDPIDIVLNPGDSACMPMAPRNKWFRWRLDQMTGLIGELSRAFREANPQGRVAARVFANYYRWQAPVRARLAQDWLHWVVEGHLDELLLEGRWLSPEGEDAYAVALGLVLKTSQFLQATPLLTSAEDGKPISLDEQLKTLQSQAEIDRVVLHVTTLEELKLAQQFRQKAYAVVDHPLHLTVPVPERLEGD